MAAKKRTNGDRSPDTYSESVPRQVSEEASQSSDPVSMAEDVNQPGESGNTAPAAEKASRHLRRCQVFGCDQNKSTTPYLTFLSAPHDNKQRNKWMRLLGRFDYLNKGFSNSQNIIICEDHFDPRDFVYTPNRKLLKKHALPSRKLPVFTTLASSQENVNVVTVNRELALRNFHTVCERFLSKELLEIVKSQAEFKIFDNTIRSHLPYKLCCLSFFHTSPQAYSMLRSVLRLPSPKKIKNLKIPVTTSLNDAMITTLKMKGKRMSAAEKVCAVVVGRVDVQQSLYYNISADRIIGFAELDGEQTTKPANRVIAVLAQGILSDWTQPVAFAMLSDDTDLEKLSNWTDRVIKAMFQAGFNIKAYVSGIESDFIRSFKRKCVDADDPYFIINYRKIYYFYDSLLLIQALYRSFFTYDYQYENNKVAKYEHIVQFYHQDKSKFVRQAKKLTPEHIETSNVEKLTVRQAEEVLSKAVGTGIATHVDFKQIDESGKETAQFIFLINELKEILTKKRFFCKSDEVSFLSRMVNLFYSLELYDCNGEKLEHIPFKQAFEITIRSTMLLMEDLKAEGHKCLKIPNHDSLRNITDKIRKKFKKSASDEPTCRQFVDVFRSLYLVEAVKPIKPSDSTHVRNTLQEFVETVREYNKIAQENPQVTAQLPRPTTNSCFRVVRCKDYRCFPIDQNESLLKICGYLLRQCLDYHVECPQFRNYCNYKEIEANSYAVYENYIAENVHYNMLIPPDSFVFYVEVLEQKFSCAFDGKKIKNPVSLSIYEQVKYLRMSGSPCPCFPFDYLQKLFIRLRLFFLLKHNNRALRRNQEFSV